MTDRELLELAAKAAGLVVEWQDDGLYVVEVRTPLQGFEYRSFRRFSPLTDDGDALRLAVALTLEVDIGTSCVIAYKRKSEQTIERYERDPYAATRRAIVRAAAAIGESK